MFFFRLHNNNNNIPENAIADSKRSLLYRPWNDILVENRSKWQAKHDAGEPCCPFVRYVV
jgi:hypothetical protein